MNKTEHMDKISEIDVKLLDVLGPEFDKMFESCGNIADLIIKAEKELKKKENRVAIPRSNLIEITTELYKTLREYKKLIVMK